MYQILPYTLKQAKKLNIFIVPSEKKNKKLDLYDLNFNFLGSIGQLGAMDYASYLKYYGKKIADERRRLYRIRHKKDIVKKGSLGYYAYKILW
jgi:hypothetical protein